MSKDEGLVRIVALALLLAVVGGCSDKRDKIGELQAFLQEKRSPVAGIEYRVLPPDVIAVSSKYVPEINGVTQKIRPDGKINLPLVGEIFVAGKTLKDIATEVALAARHYYTRVDITVYVVQYNSQSIYVFGQVRRPGPQPWTGADTLLDILSKVQPTLLAWPEKIKVVRARTPKRGGHVPEADAAFSNPGQNEKTGAQILEVNLQAMIKTGDMSHNILLRPDDVVFVPANPFAEVGLALQQILFPARPIIQAVNVPDEVHDGIEIGDDDDD